VGPRAGRKVLTLQKLPACDAQDRPTGAGACAGAFCAHEGPWRGEERGIILPIPLDPAGRALMRVYASALSNPFTVNDSLPL